jgi:hypothetical protein
MTLVDGEFTNQYIYHKGQGMDMGVNIGEGRYKRIDNIDLAISAFQKVDAGTLCCEVMTYDLSQQEQYCVNLLYSGETCAFLCL